MLCKLNQIRVFLLTDVRGKRTKSTNSNSVLTCCGSVVWQPDETLPPLFVEIPAVQHKHLCDCMTYHMGKLLWLKNNPLLGLFFILDLFLCW